MSHGLFCNCSGCKKLWRVQEAYDALRPIEADEEHINYEDEKELDRVMEFPRD
jgi:hypothetical protein